MAAKRAMTYSKAGVDIDAGDELVEHLKKINPAIGGFAGLCPLPRGMKNPRLVASTDGVGTKLLVAQLAGRHESIGIDLVAMVVNDLIVCGAKPLFFLDYFATGKLKGQEAREVIQGIVAGCEDAGCPLIGGETAEMPGMYAPGHYDLAGFGVGVVEANQVIDGRGVKPGDLIVGLSSTGLHSNGYSLARKALLPEDTKAAKAALKRSAWRGGPSLADLMLEPTRIYVRTVMDLIGRGWVKAAAHITGGGIEGNLVRVLPNGTTAWVDLATWTPPSIFELIAERGPVDEGEMFRVFNMGIGMILVVAAEHARQLVKRAEAMGQRAQVIGWMDAAGSKKEEPSVQLVRPA
ncbi:phosphoribosylformylglycinamidine cyclo-ligase [bacterium]|nr:phosphoribosylformylglycinamidine cyclo-ligase [bacterium]